MKTLIYDIEIKKAITMRREPKIEGIEYCDGWHDHANMGISCICAFDYVENRYRVFMDDNIAEFATLVAERDVIVSFNGLAFDNRVCAENGIEVPDSKSYDLLVRLWEAAGLGPKFVYPTHVGFGLDATCEKNFGIRKTGHGALAPVNYQRREFGALIDYCLNDVAMTKRLFDHVLAVEKVLDPRDGKQLSIRLP
jgi:hypothetical protein